MIPLFLDKPTITGYEVSLLYILIVRLCFLQRRPQDGGPKHRLHQFHCRRRRHDRHMILIVLLLLLTYEIPVVVLIVCVMFSLCNKISWVFFPAKYYHLLLILFFLIHYTCMILQQCAEFFSLKRLQLLELSQRK